MEPNMSQLLSRASRGLALAGLITLLTLRPEGTAQENRPQGQTDPADTAKKVAQLTAKLKDRSYWPDQYRAAEALGQLGPAAKDAIPDLAAAATKDPEPF